MAALPKGMRDYLPAEMHKRNYLFERIRSVFERYNFEPVQTPALENLKTLTDKYGDEGDKLLFRVLRSGDFVSKANPTDWEEKNSRKLSAQIADKGLRYDLTVPLARFVVMNRHNLTFPFKRYQAQPVWRADRPQKGRYREFYQFDGDVIGSNTLIHDTEMIMLLKDAFSELNLKDVTVHFNNRLILQGFAESIDVSDFQNYCTIIDKKDKIDKEGVVRELQNSGYNSNAVNETEKFLKECDNDSAGMESRLNYIKSLASKNEKLQKGYEAVRQIWEYLGSTGSQELVSFSPALARGLDYYTGSIYEVTHNTVDIGSIAGGGRYDNLTETFGLKDMPGIGISFGIERIYDILEELSLFPDDDKKLVKILAINFGGDAEMESLKVVQHLRNSKIRADLYPEAAKMKKQFGFADKGGFSHTLIIGEEELKSQKYKLKNMVTGEQIEVNKTDIVKVLNG